LADPPVGNLRAGAVVALVATIAGWRLALAPEMEVSPLLEWHRWLGTMGTGAALAAALATGGVHRRSPAGVRIYRIALFAAGMLVVVTGHVGGLLVWGANFLTCDESSSVQSASCVATSFVLRASPADANPAHEVEVVEKRFAFEPR
jgi:hypothetical protein